jgi:hypothetical protein
MRLGGWWCDYDPRFYGEYDNRPILTKKSNADDCRAMTILTEKMNPSGIIPPSTGCCQVGCYSTANDDGVPLVKCFPVADFLCNSKGRITVLDIGGYYDYTEDDQPAFTVYSSYSGPISNKIEILTELKSLRFQYSGVTGFPYSPFLILCLKLQNCRHMI